MDSSSLKKTLKSLCSSHGWSYAVFWRFHYPNSPFLTMEDAYYEPQMGDLIDTMLLQVHLLGEGTIGQVALNGKHQWIFSRGNGDETNSLGCYDENQYVLQVGSEIQCQFSSGIKTIVVIPVDLRGVVQFGSTQKIEETLEFSDQTRRSFKQMEYAPSPINIENYDSSGLLASLISSECSNNANPIAQLVSQSTPCSSTTTRSKEDSSVVSLLPIQTFAGTSIYSSLGDPFCREDRDLQKSSSSMLTFQEEFNSSKLPPYSLDDISQWFDPIPDQRINGCAAFNENSFPNSYKADENDRAAHIPYAKNDMFTCLRGEMGTIWENDALPIVDNGLSKVSELGINSVNAPRKGLFSELGLQHIFDKIVSDSNHANKRRKTGSFSLQSSNVMDKTTKYEQKKQVFPKSQVGLWIDDASSISGSSAVILQSKRAEEPVKTTKKRARPGKSARARPKDRQMIQDRLGELRKLIPVTAKLSIDSLLDRTIKHMIFLQSLEKYGDKLKQVDTPKLISQKNGVVLKDNLNGHGAGATWAFEVGGQSMVCPIIVEDLSPPGQMLIEMLCEERSMFLEIADIVRHLGLTILKGVIEAREDKIWARFIVEANKHATRMDIFWSLIHLLQHQGDDNSINQLPSNDLDLKSPLLNNYQQLPVLHPISVDRLR